MMKPLQSAYSKPRWQIIDYLFLAVLMLYVMVGMFFVPFHGDESTTIHMSQDWDTLEHNVSALMYSDHPKNQAEQDLRILNGPLSFYAIGIARSVMGIPVSQVNEQWDWTEDWSANIAQHHMPDDRLLKVGRFFPALATALSVAVVFAIGWELSNRYTAWIAAFVYATLPAVLVNGRRAVYEGILLLMITLVLLMGVQLARRMQINQEKFNDWLLLGLFSGLAMAAKHTSLLVIVPIFAALIAELIIRTVRERQAHRRNVVDSSLPGDVTVPISAARPNHSILRNALYVLSAIVIAVIIFFILNPVWWSDPIHVAGLVINQRQSVMEGQAETFGTYPTLWDRAVGLVEKVYGPPQYFEDIRHDWQKWIGPQIATYEGAHLEGIHDNVISAILAILTVTGILMTIRRLREAHIAVFAITALVVLAAIFLFTILPWQRYYLPLTPMVGLLIGLNEGWLRRD